MKVVIKIGGSLIREAPEIIARLVKEFGSNEDVGSKKNSDFTNPEAVKKAHEYENPHYSILIVPGGGLFTDSIRAFDKEFSFSADAAHWMAILGMEQYAYYLLDKSSATATETITDLPCGVSVLFPYRLIKTKDPLSHTWDVTSDTIAAWVAKQINAIFIKVTDVDGIFRAGELIREISAESLIENYESCIDPALPLFLRRNRMQCLIVNGKYPERVIRAVYGKPMPGTTVKGNI